MPYIFGKLWHLALIWAIRKAFQCILQGVRFLLANHTRLSPTSDNDSYYLWPLNDILVSKPDTLCLWPDVKILTKKNTSWKRASWRRENLWQKLRPNNPRFTTSSPTDPCSSLQKENFSNSRLGLAGSMWLPSCSQRSVENLKLQSNLGVAVLRNVDFLSEKPVHVNRRTAKKQKIMIVVERKSLQLDNI